MKKIKIFLASSSELQKDRNEFETFIARQNKLLIDKNIFLKLVIWEDFIDAVTKTRLQDEYNKAIENSDIFIMLFFTKVGKYTEEEFTTAYNKFKRDGKPIIYTYFKNASITTGFLNRQDTQSLWDFQDKIKKLGHFVTEYDGIHHLKSHFQSQLQKLDYLENIRSKERINTSNEEKKKNEVFLKFSDNVYPNKVSIKKLSTLNIDEVNIEISWPNILMESISNLEKLIHDAEEYDNQNSTFHNCDEVLINSFYDSALSTGKCVKTIIEKAPRRISKIMKGMTKYWGPISQFHKYEDSIKNFLVLCNMEMQSRLAYTLTHIHIRDKYFPSEYEIWLDYIDKKEKGIKKIFLLNEEVYWADVSTVSGRNVNCYIWGERSLIVEAYKNFNGKAVISNWFADYVIPQVELMMTLNSSDAVIQYDEVVLIRKIRDSNFKECFE